jgi:fructokinase
MQRNIYAIGETVYDIIFRNQQPVAAKAGGSTLNSVVSMGKAGLPVHFISEFACDDIGNNINNFLKNNGVATDCVYRFSDGKTSVSIAMLDEKNNASYSFYKQLPQKRLDIQLPKVTENDIVLYGSFFAISKEVRHRVQPWLKQARESGATMIYDPNFRKAHLHELEDMLPMIIENMSMASVVRGSDEDFQMIFNCNYLQDTYNKVSIYCPNLIVTANAEGIDLLTPNVKLHHDVKQLQPVSTIGAGDNFNAGLITALFKAEIKHNNIASLKAEDWTKLLASGAAFSADVCMSYDNYISDSFAESI